MAQCKAGDPIVYYLSSSIIFASFIWSMMILRVVFTVLTEKFPKSKLYQMGLTFAIKMNTDRHWQYPAYAFVIISVAVPQAILRYVL